MMWGVDKGRADGPSHPYVNPMFRFSGSDNIVSQIGFLIEQNFFPVIIKGRDI